MSLLDNMAGAKTRLVVEAIVIKACSNCGAPGVNEDQEPFGPVCPKCGTKRPEDDNKGVIFDSWRRSPWYQKVLRKLLGRS